MAFTQRKSHVERDERDCDVHGRTTFAKRIVGKCDAIRWCCMACDADRFRKVYHAKKDGTYEPKYNKIAKNPERVYPQCKTHFIALNALGECDYC